jgi:hypothetical protein
LLWIRYVVLHARIRHAYLAADDDEEQHRVVELQLGAEQRSDDNQEKNSAKMIKMFLKKIYECCFYDTVGAASSDHVGQCFPKSGPRTIFGPRDFLYWSARKLKT